jgi:hypothetical protein
VRDSRGAAFVGAVLFATKLGLVDEDVAASRLGPADFSGAMGATFPVLATAGGEVCEAGCGDTVFECGICDGGCVETIGGVCDASFAAVGFVLCSGAAVATFV